LAVLTFGTTLVCNRQWQGHCMYSVVH